MSTDTTGVERRNGAGRVSETEHASNTSAVVPTGAQTAKLLPEPTVSVSLSSITSLILLMERSFTAQRKAADQRRDAAEASQERQEKRAVDEMRKEADAILTGALTSGLISIAGGAMQLASAGMSAHALGLEAKADKVTTQASSALAKAEESATTAAKKSLEAANEAAKCTATSLKSTAKGLTGPANALSAGGGIMSASSKGAEGVFQSVAKDHQADQTQHNNAAQAASRDAKRADDMANEMGELRQKLLARLEQLIDTEQQGRLAILQRA